MYALTFCEFKTQPASNLITTPTQLNSEDQASEEGNSFNFQAITVYLSTVRKNSLYFFTDSVPCGPADEGLIVELGFPTEADFEETAFVCFDQTRSRHGDCLMSELNIAYVLLEFQNICIKTSGFEAIFIGFVHFRISLGQTHPSG